MKCVLRSNYLLPLLVPDDNAAWQDIGREFNSPVAGSLMNPIGIVVCVMAHSIKWPPAVRHFHKTLKTIAAAISGNRSPSAVSPITAAHIVTAYRDAILWVNGKELRKMHDGLSVARRSHATSGIVMAGKELGMLECVPETVNPEDKIVYLGLNLTAFKLKHRSECSGVEKLVDKFIEYANVAKIKWPCQDEEWNVFAGDVFGLMVYFHALEVDTFGLKGGRTLIPIPKPKGFSWEAWSKTPASKPPGDLASHSKVDGDYIVKHVTRHFILAADSLNVFDENVTMEQAMRYLPDKTAQVNALSQYTLGQVRKDLGCDPFLVSCHLCFAQSFGEDKLNAFLALNYSELEHTIGAWDGEASKVVTDEDSFPPNFHFLVQKALVKKNQRKETKDSVAEKEQKPASKNQDDA